MQFVQHHVSSVEQKESCPMKQPSILKSMSKQISFNDNDKSPKGVGRVPCMSNTEADFPLCEILKQLPLANAIIHSSLGDACSPHRT